MAGRRTKGPEAVVPTTAIVASAVRYTGDVPRIYNPSKPWQEEAYRHYAICGEARYAANYVGNSLSRARLFTGELTAGKMVEAAADAQSSTILSQLFGGADAQPAMLKAVGIHLTVAGECYLVGRSPTGMIERDRGADPNAQDIWEIVSVREMNVNGQKWTIRYGDGHPDVVLDASDVVIRIWTPDPANRMEADSPFKSSLPVLKEIEYLTLHIFAQCRSRLAGAGILWVPQEMDFPPPPDVDGKPVQVSTEAEGLMLRLADAMIPDIEDQGDPNSIVPIGLSAPGEFIDKARLMQFWTNLDEKALEMRAAALHRFAVGMDLPPEQIMGMGSNSGSGGGTSNGISHWGAWQVDESTIKLHIEPMLDAFTSALTISYLRPGGATNSVVLYDTSTLRLRPDRSKESLQLWDRGVLKTEIMLRENGFEVTDMPDPAEAKQWFLRKIGSGSATPEQVAAALKQMGVDIGEPSADGGELREARPAPSLEDRETRDLPERPDDTVPVAASRGEDLVLLNVTHALMFRALERAGNRLRNGVANKPNCPAYETHTLIAANGSSESVLDDAFGNANIVLDGIADYTKVVPVLQSYATDLLQKGARHDKDRLSEALRDAGLFR